MEAETQAETETSSETNAETTESKVYVGNLPFSIDQNGLKELFSSFGEISEVSLISNKFSGRSKGFGFVTFAKKEDAQKAIQEMNEKEVEGRALKVNKAKPFDPNKERPRRSFNRGHRSHYRRRQRRY